jgi:hypothetical protein
MSILSMLLPAGDAAFASFMLLSFFQGPFIPTNFAMTLRGLGRHTKLVSTGLTMAFSGSGIWPSISWAVQRYHNGNNRYMMRVTVIMYSGMLVIIAVENLHTTIRQWVDADRNATAPFQVGQGIPLNTVSAQDNRSHGFDAAAHMRRPDHIEFAGSDARVPGWADACTRPGQVQVYRTGTRETLYPASAHRLYRAYEWVVLSVLYVLIAGGVMR